MGVPYHLLPLYDGKLRSETIDRICVMYDCFEPFDSIVVCGASGMLLGGEIASRIDKQLVLVRKPEDTTHSQHLVEYLNVIKSFIILDDLIATGNTIRYILSQTQEEMPKAQFNGALLWRTLSARWPWQIPQIINDVQAHHFTDTRGQYEEREGKCIIKTLGRRESNVPSAAYTVMLDC